MTNKITAATIDHRLAEFVERVRKAVEGKTDDAAIDEVAGNISDFGIEPWRTDMRAELLDILLTEGGQLVDEIREAHYAALPQAVLQADADDEAAWRAARGWLKREDATAA